MSEKPWWHTTKTRKQSLLLGLTWSLLAVAHWALLDYRGTATWRLLPPIGFSVLGLVYITSWVMRGRHERSSNTSP
ncbi:hypothetical protein [Kineococcus rhizosphaerae]|uniref:hypothetical protein n=1 Tax=Kineococcus rhizosphaerae TaxID=559628 RepID=UPI0011B25777|nr:hypothetical protein [Kineococcus rhizosphaerae]